MDYNQKIKDNKHQYTSTYISICADIHDPKMIGRIRVKCPYLYGDSLSPWALPCFPPNSFALPEEGQMVWVKVLDDNPSSIMWVGVLYNGKNALGVPTPFQDAHAEIKDKYTGNSIDRDKQFHSTDEWDIEEHTPWHKHPNFYDPHKFGLLYPSGTKFEVHDSNDGKFVDIGLSGDNKVIDRRIKLTDVKDEEGIIIQDWKGQYIKLFDDKKDDSDWSIEIRDKNDGKMRFNPKSGEEHIKIFDKKGNEIKINTVDANEYIQLTDEFGNFIKLDATDGAEKILIQDKIGQKLILNPIAKTVTLQNSAGTGKIVIDDAGNITLDSVATIQFKATSILLGDGATLAVARQSDTVAAGAITTGSAIVKAV